MKRLKKILTRCVSKKDREKFREFETVDTWLTAIRCDSSTVSKSKVNDEYWESGTELHYLGYLIKFCWWISKDPDQIISERLENYKSSNVQVRLRFEKLVRKFSLGYKMQKKLVAARESRVALKSFFHHNTVPLIIKSSKKVHVKVRRTLKIEEVKRILEFCDVREKALVLILLQSGIRPETLVLLTYGHIKHDFEAGVFPVCIDLTVFEVKGGYAPYTALIGKDACEALRNYFNYRMRGTEKIPPEKITDKSPLIRKIDSFEPISYGEVCKIIKKVCRAAGNEQNVTPYTFRRTFQTIMEDAGVPLNWVDRLMGHIPRGAQGEAYSQPHERLRKRYLTAEPFLSVSNSVTITDENNVKLEVLHVLAKMCGVDLDEVLEKRKIKSLEEMTDEEVEALYEEYRKALQILGQSSFQKIENRNSTVDIKDCGSSADRVCPNCDSSGWKEDDNFCGACGNSLIAKCPKCGKKNNNGHKFCPKCGANLDE